MSVTKLLPPSRKNIKTFLTEIREVTKGNGDLNAGQLINVLNPKIRGWANYHRHCSNSDAFVKVDHAIFQALWRWAKRRHPKKGRHWIKKKYFRSEGARNWVFYGKPGGTGSKSHTVRLLRASDTPIKRQVKIKGEANPYDPE